jgi:hypothetical protein
MIDARDNSVNSRLLLYSVEEDACQTSGSKILLRLRCGAILRDWKGE